MKRLSEKKLIAEIERLEGLIVPGCQDDPEWIALEGAPAVLEFPLGELR